MKRLIPCITAMVLAGLAVTACDRPGTKGSTSTTSSTTSTPPTTSSTTSDTASPSTSASTSPTTGTSAGVGAAMNDTVITGKVKAAIAADPGLKDSNISVETDNGVVKLTGSVKSPDQVTLAAALAQRQEGVNRVENNVTAQ